MALNNRCQALLSTRTGCVNRKAMFYKAPCKVAEGVWALGNELFPCFAVTWKGTLLLVEPSLSGALAPAVSQMEALGLSLEGVEAVAVLHAHYDHVMMLFPLLERVKVKVYAHPAASDVLKNLKVLGHFKGSDSYSSEKVYGSVPSYEPFPIETSDIRELEGLGLEVFHLPGHSPCSVALGCGDVLFVSDAMGYFGKDMGHSPLFFYSFGDYIDSIEKLRGVVGNYRFVVAGHNCIFTGEERFRALDEARGAAERMRKRILEEGLTPENPDSLFAELYRDEYLLYPPQVIMTCAKYLIKRALSA